MAEGAAVSIAVVCEGEADPRTAGDLADRVLVEQVRWIEQDTIQYFREYRSLERSERCLPWKQVGKVAEERNANRHVAHGHFQGEPGAPDALITRKALILLVLCDNPPAAAMLIRDTDGDRERAQGLRQARQERPWPFQVILGVAHTKRECWVLPGFACRETDEERRQQRLRQELGFNPCREPHRLTARQEDAKLSAKRVLRQLTGGDADREAACWRETPLVTMRENGKETGLPDFLDEVRDRLIPLFHTAPEHEP